ncbi:PH domain-containing protein [Caenorhabditis elegans]|uniref:PH domain-containing protein n=1 Tax=Caenorhabditis elegans TaxID=6239 RepID=A5JYW4_CAEEL|nr:PH domain-containing protein [Caenorhabditis elegans]CAN86578.1 PH domain-containing protein [Caenorhabditis elegans]|eukprot:NP_001122860.1 Uncharacterized protein CELE_C25F9.12 [Caenorhabditis elegans]
MKLTPDGMVRNFANLEAARDWIRMRIEELEDEISFSMLSQASCSRPARTTAESSFNEATVNSYASSTAALQREKSKLERIVALVEYDLAAARSP